MCESYISKKRIPLQECYKGELINENILKLIQKDHPGFDKESYISIDELNQFRKKYMVQLIKEETGELNQLENEVVAAITTNKIFSENIEPDIEENLTLGQRIADKIAEFGGSWTFIISFFSFLIFWMCLNAFILRKEGFDPYPFILLNLILSCLAAIQAPIIMMSQNRQEQKDRLRGEHDYKINLKAELEIKLLHEKMDYLLIHQNKRLIEIQDIQADYLQDILKEMKAIK